MTKQEKIREAWGENFPKEGIDENGWSNEYIWHDIVDLNLFHIQTIAHGYHYRRPKSLEGIEDNNGWIKIENNYKPPTDESILYDICDMKHHRFLVGKDRLLLVDLWESVTHYKVHQPLKSPLY